MHGHVDTVEPLLTATPDGRPPCLLRPLTLVPTAQPFRIVLYKPLLRRHLPTPYYGHYLITSQEIDLCITARCPRPQCFNGTKMSQ